MDMVIGALQQQTNERGRGGRTFFKEASTHTFSWIFCCCCMELVFPCFVQTHHIRFHHLYKVMQHLSLTLEFIRVTIITSNNHVLTTLSISHISLCVCFISDKKVVYSKRGKQLLKANIPLYISTCNLDKFITKQHRVPWINLNKEMAQEKKVKVNILYQL